MQYCYAFTLSAMFLLTAPAMLSAQHSTHAGHQQHDHSQHEHHEHSVTQSGKQDHSQHTDAKITAEQKSSQAIVYSCPMHPQIQQHEPGNCPICGMALVAQKTTSASSTVAVPSAMQQSLGIRTALAGYRLLQPVIETQGMVQYAEQSIHHSHIRTEGWIEQLFIHNSGQQVKTGDKLFSYYAPGLVVAQDDYLQALSVVNQSGQRNDTLLQRAETRLHLLGLSATDINQLKQKKQSQHIITVYASHPGIITALNIRDGMYITPGDTLLEITNLNPIWLVADVPSVHRNRLNTKTTAAVTLPGSTTTIQSAIDYIYPELDPMTRSVKVRLQLDNPQALLQPNQVLAVRFADDRQQQVLAIPRDAILLSHHGSRVVVHQVDGFSVRNIETGIQAQGYTEVLSGLHEGEEVVVSGQFLLDAEASLQQLTAPAAVHQH